MCFYDDVWTLIHVMMLPGNKPEPMLTKNTDTTHTFSSLGDSDLTHLPLDKMISILADNIFKCIFLNENVRI